MTEPTPRQRLSAVRQRLIALGRELDAAVRAVVAERVRQDYPEAHILVAEGEYNEDGLLHLHAQKILDAEGGVLDGYDEDGISTSVDFDDLTDEIDALLDEISERDESYQGTHEFDVAAPVAAPFGAAWRCTGCGREIAESDADMIADHVRDCDLVDGAGHPVEVRYWIEPIGFGDGVYGPFDDEIEASSQMDASEFLSDETHKIVPRPVGASVKGSHA